jgi:hypothetical protein
MWPPLVFSLCDNSFVATVPDRYCFAIISSTLGVTAKLCLNCAAPALAHTDRGGKHGAVLRVYGERS